ncbi:hypothetical protein HBI62_155680 [Parastagonospora nodorum]|nr:hypothetical protein HBI62_155680 [Parastagonospora nodorum]KAH6148322.1 hypothetical protein HBI63_149230 [Parastagonospora nodorum]KAH6173710.1 hypothetical protein HBI61_160420 [Parastagonospora nodorum]
MEITTAMIDLTGCFLAFKAYSDLHYELREPVSMLPDADAGPLQSIPEIRPAASAHNTSLGKLKNQTVGTTLPASRSVTTSVATITYWPCLNSKPIPDHVIAATCSTKSSSNFRPHTTTKPNPFASRSAIARHVRRWVTSTCAPSTLLSTTFSYHQTRKILATIAASRKSTGGISARTAACASWAWADPGSKSSSMSRSGPIRRRDPKRRTCRQCGEQ